MIRIRNFDILQSPLQQMWGIAMNRNSIGRNAGSYSGKSGNQTCGIIKSTCITARFFYTQHTCSGSSHLIHCFFLVRPRTNYHFVQFVHAFFQRYFQIYFLGGGHQYFSENARFISHKRSFYGMSTDRNLRYTETTKTVCYRTRPLFFR